MVTIVALSILLVGKGFGQKTVVVASIVCLVGVLALGYTSSRDSQRAINGALGHTFQTYILPYPSRVQFVNRLGMPDPSAAGYLDWWNQNAASAYGLFLLAHPRFVVTTIWDNLESFRGSFSQQYYRGLTTKYRESLYRIGELVHPETNAVYLLDALLCAALGVAAARRPRPRSYASAWLGAWLAVGSVIVLMAGFFGDTEGFRRHMYPSIEALRLLFWLLILLTIDGMLVSDSETPKPAAGKPGPAIGALPSSSMEDSGTATP
jgi:hypothetical protein